MKKNLYLKPALYLVLMTSLIVWLICADQLISDVINEQRVSVINFDETLKSFMKDKVEYSTQGVIDFWTYNGGMTQKMVLSGWGFCQTEENNDERYMTMLFKNTKSDLCYAFPLKLAPRPDIPKSHNKMQIPSDLVGYEDSYSLIAVHDGVYDIYMCCWENYSNHGISYSSWQLEKNGDEIEFHPWSDLGERIENVLIPTNAEKPVGYLDSISCEEGFFRISDWAFIDGVDCSNQKIYLEFKNHDGLITQYNTVSSLRTDVAAAYDDKRYAMSGYHALIPTDDIEDGIYTVRVIIEAKGEIYASEEYPAVKENDTIILH